MTSKASNQRDITDVIKKQKRDNKKAAGIARAQASGISGSDTAIAGGQKTQAGSAGASNVTQDLLMNTYDIRDVDRLYFSTTAGSADVLTANDTGIESKSYYNGTSYVSYGINHQVPANNIHTFHIGSTERFNIGTSNSALNSNLGLGGYLDIGANYIQVDETTPTLVGTVPADERRIFSDSTNNSELSVKKSDGSVVSLEGGGSSGGAGLADNNTWTGSNTFQGIVSMTGASITLGDASTDIINFGGKAGTDLNMGTYDITNLDNISFGAGTQNIADTTTPVNNLFVKQVRLQSGSLTTNKPNITSSSSGGNTVDLNFTTGSGFLIYEQGVAKHIFSGSSLTTPNILSSGTWTLTSDTNSPNTNGMFARVGGHVKVYTGGALKSLSDIGTGSGGASLSGTNVWTGSNTFQSAVSMTGASVIIGNSSSDLLYIDSTISQNLDMGDNKITDLATPTSNYDAATKKYVDDNAGSGGGANTSLSNLGTTSINADLDPSSNATKDLGSSSKKWRYIYAIQLVGAAVTASSLSMSGDIDLNGNTIDYVGGLTNTGNGTFAWSGSGSFQTTCNVTALYSTNIYIGASSGDNVGFFGATPVGKQYIPANATLANIVMALRNLGLGS
jgi:hypothetical protein